MSGFEIITRRSAIVVSLAIASVIISGSILVFYEIKTCRFQSKYYAERASKLTYTIREGKSPKIVFPWQGPHNERRGYNLIPSMISSLEKRAFEIDQQAVISGEMAQLYQQGLPLIFPELKQAGLVILDRQRDTLYKAYFPDPIYQSFDSIPALVVKTLLFIEDRNLLDSLEKSLNPAVNWKRLLGSIWQFGLSKIGLHKSVPGASTLATQVEKFRYWPEGRTQSIQDKFKQMKIASLRAYSSGPNTWEKRKQIILDHINSAPFSAYPQYGEVNGIGEALEIWYGVPLDTVNYYLHKPEISSAKAGLYYRMVLSLLIAYRRPSYYLLSAPDELEKKALTYLKLIRKASIITEPLYQAALKSHPVVLKPGLSFVNKEISRKKAASSIRMPLLAMLHIDQLYKLDRLHCTVKTTLDADLTAAITIFLRRLKEPRILDSLGLREARMLQKGNPEKVIYSFSLYERKGNYNVLRIQAESKDNPLNLNEGMKLDLGSTAKLRTLITYLQIMEELYNRFHGNDTAVLNSSLIPAQDTLTGWAKKVFKGNPAITLNDLLDSAMMRTYSANPNEKFFTGGGIHLFVNFDSRFDNSSLSILEAFRNSVNLVFVRLMRDIESYYAVKYIDQGISITDTSSISNFLLNRFIERESTHLLARYYQQLKNVPSNVIIDTLIAGSRPTASKISAIYCTLAGKPTMEGLTLILHKYGFADTNNLNISNLFRKFTSASLTLSDKAFIASLHPLKLWTALNLLQHPDISLGQIQERAKPFLDDAYRWLRNSENMEVKNSRIRQIMEIEAFSYIHESWSRLGYQFSELVPSYATALGVSADRPSALAELAGIIQNDGIRYQLIRSDTICFAEGTPYYTRMHCAVNDNGTRVLSSQVTEKIKRCLYDVTENGTGQRARNAFQYDSKILRVGGKTGTGDHRAKRIAKDGTTISERVMNRTAIFVFILGDRFFGTITAFVPGEDAKDFIFTSAYPVQVLKSMAPLFKRLLLEPSQPSIILNNKPSGAIMPAMVSLPIDSSTNNSEDTTLVNILEDDSESSSSAFEKEK